MPYIGNTIRAADDYRLIDDISSGFNGSATSFALQVAGSAPVPFPKSPQQVLISVNGVIQEPDPTGASGFNLVGTNIVFSSAPTNGHAFFGIIYATADYLNSGGNFPSGSLGAPSITFVGDEDTGIYRKGSGSVAFVADSTEIANTDSNGLTISSGNLIIPDSIIHNGDTNTKIRFPAADTVTIETAGSEKLRVDSAGKIGIGTDSPSAKLHVIEDIYAKGSSGDGSVGIQIRSGGSALSNQHQIRTGGGTGEQIFIEALGSSSAVVTKVNGSERMRIDSSGRLLLGTTTVGETTADDLTIATSGSTGITLRSGTSSAGNILFSDGTSGDAQQRGIIQYHHSDNSMRFFTDATRRMTIDSSGKVGIGTTSPNRTLTVQSNGGQMSINDTDNTNGGIFCNAGLFSFYARGNSNLGDGSTQGVFEVQTHEAGGSTSQKFRIDGVGKLSTGGETAPDVSAGGICLNQASQSANILTFKSSDIAHGVTTFDETDTYFSARKSSDNKGGLRLHAFTDQAGADPAFEFHGIIASDSAVGYVPFEFRGHEANGTGTQNIASDRRIAKFTNSDGTIITSITGTGITFGNDTAAANALDDYEEGTFNAQVVGGSSVTQIFDQTGRYTKIGNFVHVQGIAQFSGTGNGTTVFMSLPFNHVTSTALGGGLISFTNVAGLTGQSTLSLVGQSGQAKARVKNKTADPTISGTQSNKAIYYHFAYQTA
jgi:hypothetical protein